MDLYQNLFHTPELPYAARKLINQLFFRSLAGYLVLYPARLRKNS